MKQLMKGKETPNTEKLSTKRQAVASKRLQVVGEDVVERKQSNKKRVWNINAMIGWVIAILLVSLVVATYLLPKVSPWIVLTGWCIGIGISLILGWFTDQGQQFLKFVKESHIEIRKVVWPSRQETVQTTIMVTIIVVVTSLILWGMDSILLWVVGLISGQRG